MLPSKECKLKATGSCSSQMINAGKSGVMFSPNFKHEQQHRGVMEMLRISRLKNDE